jgi:hypothetical protein
MSNEINSTVMDNMRDNVHELWSMEGRPDLEDDCLQYCYDNIDRPVLVTMIEFLSSHCGQAMSSEDYKHMHKDALLNAKSKKAYDILKKRMDDDL